MPYNQRPTYYTLTTIRKMIRIVHIYKSFLPESMGGCEQVIKSLAKTTTPLGCHNTVITATNRRSLITETIDQVDVFRYPQTINFASCPISLRLMKEFKSRIEAADILHYHFPWPFADTLHLMKNIQKPTVMTYHSDIVRQKFLKKMYQPLMKAFLNRIDTIVPTSENLLMSSIDLQPYRMKCSPIPIGVDDRDYFPIDSVRVTHYEKTIGRDFMLFIGVMRYYKGLHYLLDAIANTNIALVIAGSGPMERQLKQQAKRLGLQNVHFVGAVSERDKSALLHLCRAVVAPSHVRAEAFGVTLVEGLIFGKPLISTELATGTSYVNENGVTGFIVKPGDPAALREAMQMLNTDLVLTQKMGQAARARYERYFTAEKMGSAYYQLYHQLK